MKTKNKLLLIVFILILISLGYFGYLFFVKPCITDNSAIVQIGKVRYQVEIADDYLEIIKGLSGRPFLNQDRGMLFIFNKKDYHIFGMKGMQFPIDIIWVEDDKIVDMTENVPVPPDSNYLIQYKPKMPVNKVLEVNAGETKRNNISLGQKISISLLK